MARDHAVIRLDMWGDDDWRRLSVPAQHLYMLLLTSPTLSFCGVADWRPARIARLAGGWDVSAVLAAADELRDGLFLIIDGETEEVLIRSFVRYDGVMKMPNMATAMATAHAAIASAMLRGVVVHELRRLHDKHPDLPGWKSQRAMAVLERDSIDPSRNPSVNPSGNPSVRGSAMGSGNPSVNPSPTPAPSPAPAPSSSNEEEKELTTLSAKTDEPEGFAEFYAAYPRKEARRKAATAFRAALKRASLEEIMDGLEQFPFRSDRQFQPLPASWLNADRWADETVGQIAYDTDKLPEPGTGWSDAQLDMVLGKDTWIIPPLSADMDEDEAWKAQQLAIRRHRAERVQAALIATGRATTKAAG